MANIMTVMAPENLQSQLKDRAQRQGLTRNALILQILWDWIKKNENMNKED